MSDGVEMPLEKAPETAWLELVSGNMISARGVELRHTPSGDTHIELAPPGVSIGAVPGSQRGPFLHIANYPNEGVGRAQAFVQSRGADWMAIHSGTTNPTFVNREILAEDKRLEDGDVISFCNGTSFLFRVES